MTDFPLERRFLNPPKLSMLVILSLLTTIAPTVQAQALPPDRLQIAQADQTNAPTIFVNPQTGNNTNNGSDSAPFKTLTHALSVTNFDGIIKLAPGTYSNNSGEVFPIQLRSGVTVQGEPSDRGQNVIIQGSGLFLSKTSARQQVTILGSDRAGLLGVTVSNLDPQGYGLWIESSSPVVSDSTFTSNGHDGVSIVGNSAPILKNNYFYNNGANGITIYGTSRPEIRDSIFEKTGFGINIAQNSAPRITGNRITGNKDGIVVQGRATPIFRSNVIDGNDRDGLVTIATSRPNLGTQSDRGNNTFVNNGGLDINAKFNSQVIPAAGNQYSKTSGRLDLNSIEVIAQAATQPPEQASYGQFKSAQELTFTRSEVSPNIASTKSLAPAIKPVKPSVATPAIDAFPSELLVPIAVQPGSSGGRSLPVPKSAKMKPAKETSAPLGINSVNNRAFLGTPPATTPPSPLLRVPGADIPVGNIGDMSSVPVWRQSGRQTARPVAERPVGVKFRVVVEMVDADRLRLIVPGAFAVVSNGKKVMQAGAFADSTKANQLLSSLASQGIRATTENF